MATAVQVPPRDPWLCKDFKAIEKWRTGLIKKVEARRKSAQPDPSIDALRELIETEPGLKDLANNMFKEIPLCPTYDYDPSGYFKRVTDYNMMLQILDYLIHSAPEWNDQAYAAGLLGVPINALLNWPMATESGHRFFLNKKVNKCFEGILQAYGKHLKSSESAKALDSWFKPDPLKTLTDKATPCWPDGKRKTFEQIYDTPSGPPNFGFKSWDGFFSRKFRNIKDVRPIGYPDKNHEPKEPSKAVIANACESVVYQCVSGVKEHDSFWLKGQPYSLADMLDHHRDVKQFVNGTVYQAWLAAECYHRWHSPVSGRIKDVVKIPGTYFSGLQFWGFPEESGNRNKPDPSGPNLSQRYITAVGTRALIFIEADNPAIGLMCFIAVGMDEISSCEVTVKKEQLVMKGQEIGTFHLGGSTHCLIFRPGVNLDWSRDAQPPFSDTDFGQHPIIPVNKWLAYVPPSTAAP